MSNMSKIIYNENTTIASEHDIIEPVKAVTTNSLLFTHDYIGKYSPDNEFALIIHSASRTKALHVGTPAKINFKNEKLSCVATMEILSGSLSVNEYDNTHTTLDTLLERMDSMDFDIETDMYDDVEDDVSDSLSALNNTVFE